MERIWGSLAGEGAPIGELWWIYHDQEGSAALRSKSGESTTVGDLVRRGLLPGMSGRYPILVKTLHTAERLSVQVHPGREGGGLCKEETWVVLTARPGSWLLAGLAAGATPEGLEAALEEGRMEDLLVRFEMEQGQAIHIPPGTVHALGGGLEILEIQRNCDVTYRLHDWNRVGVDGKPRELHLRDGLRAVEWSAEARPSPVGSGHAPRTGELYRIKRLEGGIRVPMAPGSVLFLEDGAVPEFDSAGWRRPERPWLCLLADNGGGAVELSGRATMASLL